MSWRILPAIRIPGTGIAAVFRRKMKIAQIAPLAESVPPRLYGGTERVVSYLTEELVRLGHDVTLFASGDSQTSARLVACAPRALRLDPSVTDALPHHLLMIERVRSRVHEFDVLHFHVDQVHLPLSPVCAQVHHHSARTPRRGRPCGLYREFDEMPLVSISDSQRKPLPFANWVGTVYHGLAEPVCPFNPGPRGNYLAFLGRMSPEKGVERAIEIARRAGRRLRIAAKIDRTEEDYYRSRVAPLLSDRSSTSSERSAKRKTGVPGQRRGLLFPIDWPEPFGLAMIEAMSCGTPVIAWPNGCPRSSSTASPDSSSARSRKRCAR